MSKFQRNKVTNEALRREMTNISRSPFTDKIEQTERPHKFSMPHFTSFKGDGDPERHLKHYRSAMVLYRNNDALMCKIFATTLQGEAQDWFHTLPPRSISSFDDLSLVFTKEYSSYRTIKKKSDYLFKNPKESLRDYEDRWMRRLNSQCSLSKGPPRRSPLFGEMIMKEDLTLADSFTLAEKHALWDEARRAEKVPEQPKKRIGGGSKKGRWKAAQQKQTGSQADGQAHDQGRLHDPELLEVSNSDPLNSPRREEWAVVQATKYCASHRGPSHATESCCTWRNYLEKLVREGKVDKCSDKPAAQARMNAEKEDPAGPIDPSSPGSRRTTRAHHRLHTRGNFALIPWSRRWHSSRSEKFWKWSLPQPWKRSKAWLDEQPPSTVSSSGLLIDASLSSKPSRGRNVMSGMKNAKKPSKTWRSISHRLHYYPNRKQRRTYSHVWRYLRQQ